MWPLLCLALIFSFSKLNAESNEGANVEISNSNNNTDDAIEGNSSKRDGNKTAVEMERIVQPIVNQRVLDPLPSNTNISTKLEKVEGKSINDFRPSPQLEETNSYEYNKFPVQPAFPEAKHLGNFNLGEYESPPAYRPPDTTIQWPGKNQAPPILTTESPWTTRVKFPTTPSQRSREHFHHHYYAPPTEDSNKYLPPDRHKYSPPESDRYLLPDGNKFLPPDGNKYLPPDGNKYLPPDGNKYLPPDGNKYLPPERNKYLPPDGSTYFPPRDVPHKLSPPTGPSYFPTGGGDKSYQGKYGPPSGPSGPQAPKHWLDGPSYRPSSSGSSVPGSTSVGVWDRRPPSTHKTQYEFSSYDRPYIEPSGGSKFDVGKPYVEPPVSPWKKIIKILTAFIPIGLLISALTPTVITVTPVNNTSDLRLRAEDPKREAAKRLISSLTYFNNLNGERCEDRILCELLVSASNSKNAEENVKNLLNNFTEQDKNIGDRAEEMKRIFDAVRDQDCSSIICNTIRDA